MTPPPDDCLTGACPRPQEEQGTDIRRVKLSEGSGGKEMGHLIAEVRNHFPSTASWKHTGADGAVLPLEHDNLVFTTDSFVVTPLFFPGGNIGKLAFCGTVNDLVVMGADPLGLSLALVIEEGFPKDQLTTIMETIGALAKKQGIPIVTGDTKVMEKGSIDKIIINTSGIGIASRVLGDPVQPGDKIIVSGSIGEHGAVLLAQRFALETSLSTDSKPLLEELRSVRHLIRKAKDITRGGLAAVLNEVATADNRQFLLKDGAIPLLPEVRGLTELLGIDAYALACEGRFVCFAGAPHADMVLQILKRFHPQAAIIGEVMEGTGVILQTAFGKRVLPLPSGNLVPRIC